MGQQQLLLIVLGVIIVGIAVVVGINVFTASAASSNRDAVIADLTTIGSMAQGYYRKPTALGGGNNTFTGWIVPAQLSQTSNMSAAVTPTVAAQSVVLVGVGTETGNDGAAKVKATMTVTPTAMTTVVNN
jgi:Tfp pilus assembly protein PilE